MQAQTDDQGFPSDRVQVSLSDVPALGAGVLYRMSEYPDSPPFPPSILTDAADSGDNSSGPMGWMPDATNCAIYYSASSGALFVDDREAVAERMLGRAAMNDIGPPGDGGDDGGTNDMGGTWSGAHWIYGTNDFWLEPVSIVSNHFSVALHGTTNGVTYLISSTGALSPLRRISITASMMDLRQAVSKTATWDTIRS